MMKLTEAMQTVINNAPYISLVTQNADGTPHPIIVGGKQLEGDTITIGIYKMEVTRKNLARDNTLWVMAAMVDENGPKAYRFKGTAAVDDKRVVFTPETAEPMI